MPSQIERLFLYKIVCFLFDHDFAAVDDVEATLGIGYLLAIQVVNG